MGYRDIAGDLRMALEGMREGDRLPSEAQLMERYGVARQTVRSAVRLLESEGLVRAEHGRGVFACAPGVHAMVRYRYTLTTSAGRVITGETMPGETITTIEVRPA